MKAAQVAIFAGSVALALILGALFFQYILNYPPCEICHWQRWPHIAAAFIGLGGGFMLRGAKSSLARPLAVLTVLLIAASVAIGGAHAASQCHVWAGPASLTTHYRTTGT